MNDLNHSGLPYKGKPNLPEIQCGDNIRKHVPVIAAKIYMGLSEMTNPLVPFVTKALSAKCFNNDIFKRYLQMAIFDIEHKSGPIIEDEKKLKDIIDVCVSNINAFIIAEFMRTSSEYSGLLKHEERVIFNSAYNRYIENIKTIR